MEQGYQTEVRGGESGHWVVSRSHQTMPERVQVDGGGGGGGGGGGKSDPK